jgi:hypothetical protein
MTHGPDESVEFRREPWPGHHKVVVQRGDVVMSSTLSCLRYHFTFTVLPASSPDRKWPIKGGMCSPLFELDVEDLRRDPLSRMAGGYGPVNHR